MKQRVVSNYRSWSADRLIFFSADDGFKLTYLGYDFLSLKAMSHRETVSAVGKQIGVGKESGLLFLCFVRALTNTCAKIFFLWLIKTEKNCALSFIGESKHVKTIKLRSNALCRLGRTSFRAIKNKRDYMKHRKAASWLYMSRLAAIKEYAFMKALYAHDFPVPKPIDHSRHCVLMSLCKGYPMYVFTLIKEKRISLFFIRYSPLTDEQVPRSSC